MLFENKDDDVTDERRHAREGKVGDDEGRAEVFLQRGIL